MFFLAGGVAKVNDRYRLKRESAGNHCLCALRAAGLHLAARTCTQVCVQARTTAMPITIYGIKNCETMKKARAWLDEAGVAYDFHDYKTAGIERSRLEGWVRELGWETVLNRAGTTFRKLPDVAREGLDESKAIALMLEQQILTSPL